MHSECVQIQPEAVSYVLEQSCLENPTPLLLHPLIHLAARRLVMKLTFTRYRLQNTYIGHKHSEGVRGVAAHPPVLHRPVNPIRTGEGRLCPPHYYSTPDSRTFLRPCYQVSSTSCAHPDQCCKIQLASCDLRISVESRCAYY